MKELKDFLAEVGASYEPEGERVSLNNRRFAVAPEVAAQIHDRGRMVFAGKLLGRTMGEFIPGASLLHELGKMEGPHKVWVDERVGWLFACGRDVFAENIVKSEGKLAEGACFLVMMGGDCLGYGRVETQGGKTILMNVFDVGDFLRRERGLEEDR
jgi:ribosome biogenesis protein Nip4